MQTWIWKLHCFTEVSLFCTTSFGSCPTSLGTVLQVWKLSYKSGSCPTSLGAVPQIWELSYKSGSCTTNLGSKLTPTEWMLCYWLQRTRADQDPTRSICIIPSKSRTIFNKRNRAGVLLTFLTVVEPTTKLFLGSFWALRRFIQPTSYPTK